MIVFPNAKINIGLRIVARRADGYHDIETVFYPVMLNDALEFVSHDSPGRDDEIIVSGIAVSVKPEDNLVKKALAKLRQEYGIPLLRIHLHKAIPAGAGLGGGSSDASCFMKALNRFYSLGMTEEKLKELSLDIGSDCPFFIGGVPSFATGRGEDLEPLPSFLEGYYLVLMNPGVHVSTREAYAACIPSKPSESLKASISAPVSEWRDVIVNDFENYASGMFPVIGSMKKALYDSGALFSLMSGSGSSVFGIFDRKPEIDPEFSRYIIFEGKL